MATPMMPAAIPVKDKPHFGPAARALARLLLLASCLATTSDAECIDYESYVHRVGGVDTPGGAHAVAVAGTLAYVEDTQSLQVIDLSNPRELRVEGSAMTLGYTNEVGRRHR